jgi:type VI secretion system protein ImpK
MPDDPFAGLTGDRTVMMPIPGGRTVPGRPGPGEPGPMLEEPAVTSGLNPLVAAANPLFNTIPQLRSSIEHPNPSALRDGLAQGIRKFEAQARAGGVSSEHVVAARYALCTLIDETAGSTPWGSSGAWAQKGLLALFHNEVGGGEKFFQLLGRLAENPQANLHLLEFMYVCLELGLEGRYRVAEGGLRQLDAVRQRLLSIIRKQRGEYERDLSPSWRGVPAVPQSRLAWLPLWVVGAVAAVLATAIYFVFSLSLSRASDRLATDIASVRVGGVLRPALAPAPEPRLTPFLADEIQQGLVAVDDRVDRSIVTLLGDGFFKPGDVTVAAAQQPLLFRIADAVARVPGQVDVIGHTDNAPIRTLRFPSNWELSRARADSVAELLATRVSPSRLRASGRGESEPIASNDGPEGRARNRRVEIVVYVPAGSAGPPSTAAPAPQR